MIGPHSVPINLLKILKQHSSYALIKFINQSFPKGTFLIELKVAKVVPVFKKGDPEVRSSNRPISLLPILNEVFEKLVCIKGFIHFKPTINFYIHCDLVFKKVN